MTERDDRYEPTHPRHRELMLPCCATGSHGLTKSEQSAADRLAAARSSEFKAAVRQAIYFAERGQEDMAYWAARKAARFGIIALRLRGLWGARP